MVPEEPPESGAREPVTSDPDRSVLLAGDRVLQPGERSAKIHAETARWTGPEKVG